MHVCKICCATSCVYVSHPLPGVDWAKTILHLVCTRQLLTITTDPSPGFSSASSSSPTSHFTCKCAPPKQGVLRKCSKLLRHRFPAQTHESSQQIIAYLRTCSCAMHVLTLCTAHAHLCKYVIYVCANKLDNLETEHL